MMILYQQHWVKQINSTMRNSQIGRRRCRLPTLMVRSKAQIYFNAISKRASPLQTLRTCQVHISATIPKIQLLRHTGQIMGASKISAVRSRTISITLESVYFPCSGISCGNTCIPLFSCYSFSCSILDLRLCSLQLFCRPPGSVTAVFPLESSAHTLCCRILLYCFIFDILLSFLWP